METVRAIEYECIGERSGWRRKRRRYLRTLNLGTSIEWIAVASCRQKDYPLAEDATDAINLFASGKAFAYFRQGGLAPVLVHPAVWRKLNKRFDPHNVSHLITNTDGAITSS